MSFVLSRIQTKSKSWINLWFSSILKEGFASSINNIFVDFFSIAENELVKLGLLENRKLTNKEFTKIYLEGFNN